MAETATETTETDGNEATTLIPIDVASFNALLACGIIVQQQVLRAWDGLENSNLELLRMASAFGLQIERAPTDDETEDGEFEAGDIVLSLSPVFAEIMAGFEHGMASARSEMAAAAEEENAR